jgi:hypothetical protein
MTEEFVPGPAFDASAYAKEVAGLAFDLNENTQVYEQHLDYFRKIAPLIEILDSWGGEWESVYSKEIERLLVEAGIMPEET